MSGMDDILSAALGQSGLNLNYLETHDQNPGKIVAPSVDDDDVTDLLNLLNSPDDNEEQNSTAGVPQSSTEVLNMVLNYPFDHEDCIEVPSPNTHELPIYSNRRFTEEKSLYEETSSKAGRTPLIDKEEDRILFPAITPTSPLLNNRMSAVKRRLAALPQSTVGTTLSSSHPYSNAKMQSSVTLKPTTGTNYDGTSDIEKRKKSIQHVLASPNLTDREKQFLMKSALSHQMIPTLTSNLSAVSPSSKVTLKSIPQEYDDDGTEENEMVHADTFSEYMPSKVKIGHRHPDPVVETSSMASVAPPDVWYKILIPEDAIQENKLSALQLESIIYASQQHESILPNGNRGGFLIGDGAGVGKGRTVAGIIYENYLHGRKKAIWLSVSNDLRFDAIRDLRDIGCHMKVLPLNKFKYDEKITSKANGKFKKGCVFSTYSALISETNAKVKFSSRLQQLVHWFGKDYDGVIILDECHKAKNLMPIGSSKPTKTGLTVLKLQDQLPKARVVYCSATGASEPKNMAYMNRLGLWGRGTAFKEFTDFLASVEKRGVGAMEMVAMDMKLRGMYMARQLSFSGVSFDISEVKLADSFVEMYDAAVKLWVDARLKFETAADLVGLDGRGKKTMWGQFWSSHQRFFKYLCIAAKVKHAVNLAKEAIALGKCVIFGLQSTGESRIADQIDELGGELFDLISTTKGVFSTLIEKHFPTTNNLSKITNPQKPEDRKRKLEELQKKSKRRKREDLENFSRSSSDGESDDLDVQSSHAGSSDSEDGSEIDERDRNPFDAQSSDSNSEDEDQWLCALKEKKMHKPLSSKVKKDSVLSEDFSATALAAAGISTGRQYSWVSSPSAPVGKELLCKPTTQQTLEKQVLTLSNMSTLDQTDPEETCKCMKTNLLQQLDVIAPYLPPNTLDELIDELGGPAHVAEMTGRKGRVLAKENGSFAYEQRSKDDVPLEILNVAEKKRFMDGEKLIAVISEAASSGISLQADRRAKNQRRRVHITLELPWSADKAIQQFGRSHRSNQVSAPEYLFLISELAGEQRFASIIAKRLESLGALTHGDRRSNESRDFSRYNFDTRYGRQALDAVLKSVIGHEKPMVCLRGKYNESFLQVVKESLVGIGFIQKDERNGVYSLIDKDYTNISRFLNRILGLTVQLQNSLFQYFIDTLTAIIKEAKRSGRWDEGIVDLGSQGETVLQTESRTFVCPATCGKVTTHLVSVSVERGLSYKRALAMQAQCEDENEGFYFSNQLRNGKKTGVLILRECSSGKSLFSVYRPNIGLIQKQETWDEISRKYTKTDPIDVEACWNDQYEYSENNCIHAFWRGFCKRQVAGLPCEVGTRKRTCHILSGSVLSVWSKVESILSLQPSAAARMQIIRTKLDNGHKVVGLLIPSNCVDALIRILSIV